MDVTWLVSLLVPHLPFLLGLGEKAVNKGAEKLGEKGAEGIWNKLSPQIKAKPSAQEAAADVAKNPDDADAVAALRNQLKKILEAPENKTLAAEISKILEDIKAKSEGTGKTYNTTVKDSNVGAIGDQNTVTQNIGPKQ